MNVAELTTLEEKLAEVLGLAQAAQGAAEKIEGMVEDEEIVGTLKQMRDEAEETERRCTEVADSRDGKKTAILEKAQETKTEATEMMSTYLGESELVGWALPIQERPFRRREGRLAEAGRLERSLRRVLVTRS
jgi:hypothetical protein